MLLKHFRVQCTVRVLGIGATMLLALYLFFETTSYVAATILSVVVGFQLVGLIRYVEKTNQDLDRFLRSIRYSDFSQTFEGGRRGKSFELLGRAFSEVMDEFRAERAEKEESYRYLQTVMQHVGIGLLSFRQDGTVGLINTAAKRLLRVSHLKHLRALEATAGRGLADTLLRMRSGEKVLVKVVDDDELLQLAIYATEFKLRGDLYKLVSIQDIQSELEEKEIEAWQKLTRVLTHEIMNSITPIASLASTVNDLLVDLDVPPAAGSGAGDEAADDPADETIADVRDAVRTIEKRSQSLLGFVQAYRSLTRIPKPDFRIVPVADLVENVTELLRLQLRERGIRLVTSVQPTSLTVTADPSLIEQVLINLLKNAAEAVQGRADAEIRLAGAIDERGRTILQVVDNGSGIVPEALDKIFIPFFTTKKEGSGIGLSLSREIMRQHGGTISVVSDPDVRTVFTLRF